MLLWSCSTQQIASKAPSRGVRWIATHLSAVCACSCPCLCVFAPAERQSIIDGAEREDQEEEEQSQDGQPVSREWRCALQQQ